MKWARVPIQTDMLMGTLTHTLIQLQAHCTQFIIRTTVTGKTFRGKERGALNNECEEPHNKADEPLK